MLYNSIIIRARDEKLLHQVEIESFKNKGRMGHVKNITVRSSLDANGPGRCIHNRDMANMVRDGFAAGEDSMGMDELAKSLLVVLRQLKPDILQSFRLATFPPESTLLTSAKLGDRHLHTT